MKIQRIFFAIALLLPIIGFSQIKPSRNCYKPVENANPISSVRFCADPTAIEYNGRLYVYGTSDHQQYEFAGLNGKNTYDKIFSFEIFSTLDMVNWTYHGTIDVKSVAPWIMNSWAPSICSRKEEDGKTHFYLYFSNNGTGVGVITSTDPVGPWSDPLGAPLITSGMPEIGDVPNPFDPGVCIDDNGVGWLAFGGGIAKNGTEALPRTARIARLGADMVSIDTVAEIKAPYFFEASELNFINGTYVYTYNNNWAPRMDWNYKIGPEPSQCSMSYMTTKTPLDTDSWDYRGHYFQNPGDQGLCYSNNHTHIAQFRGKYYLLYHTMALHQAMTNRNEDLAFRSLCVDEMKIDEENVKIPMVNATRKGVSLKGPGIEGKKYFITTEMTTSADVEFVKTNNQISVKSQKAGAWICIKGIDFADNKYKFSCDLQGKGTVEIRLDKLNSKTILSLTEDKQTISSDARNWDIKSGKHDVYILFSDKDMYLKWWRFEVFEP